ncbi:MAG: hypothetical protein ACFFCW_05030 [Candidatus Hodarchaeota archaeon]
MKTIRSYNELIGFGRDDVERAYLGTLDKMVCTLANRPNATLQSVMRGARGAFPTLVVQRIKTLGLNQNLSEELEASASSKVRITGPELHLLDFEWYFTSKSANYLGRILTNETGGILCLSAPTVAAAIAHRRKRVLLVDRNPLILHRLPRNLGFFQFILFDLMSPLPLRGRFSVVFFDAPWYQEFVSLWLWQASQVVHVGGLVAFALFPPLLRAGAEQERSQILKQASILGDVELIEECLSYETPLFEEEALASCGVRMTTSWRRADLALVRVKRTPMTTPPTIGDSGDRWDSFLIGQQVVKLRNPCRGESGTILAPLKDCPDYVLPSVSRRDLRRDQVDLWTSRNRVARVGRRDIVSVILSHLAKGLDFDKLLQTPAFSSISLKDRKQVISSLCSILGFS